MCCLSLEMPFDRHLLAVEMGYVDFATILIT